MKINLVFRGLDQNKNSIEELFNAISNKMKLNGIEILSHRFKYSKSSPASLIRNLISLRSVNDGIFHITGEIHYAAICSKLPTVLTIHDTRSLLPTNILIKVYKYIFWFLIPSLFVDHITVISLQTYTEVRKLLPFFCKDRISLIPNPVDVTIFEKSNIVDYQPSFADKIHDDYILHVGVKKNKNLEKTAKCVCLLGKSLLVLGNLSEEQILFLNNLNGLKWISFSSVDFKDVIWLYKNSLFVSFISLYEGFGMPILEAQAAGIPVVTSNFSPMIEVAGNGAIFVNPYDEKSILEGYRHCLNPTIRNDVISKGKENVEKYNIDAIVGQYANIYKALSTC